MLSGTIDSDGSSGDVAGVEAFGWDDGDKLLFYVSSTPGVTCDSLSEYLSASGEFDPSSVLTAGMCDFFFRLSDSYDSGGWSVETGDLMGAGAVVNCAMEDGTWELETRDDDTDYYYTGRWWQGTPDQYSYTFSGGGEGGTYTAELEMSSYSGSFIYEDFVADEGSGNVSGTVTAEWCGGLGTTGL